MRGKIKVRLRGDLNIYQIQLAQSLIERIKDAPRYSEEAFDLLKQLTSYLDLTDMENFRRVMDERLSSAKMEDGNGNVVYEATKSCEILGIDPQSVSHLMRKIPYNS